jgi:geranylgeranyl reductase family protein
MKTYDLIVCGAGPGGSIAARNAAQKGLKVALIEKERLPRHKTCGGGIPSTVIEHLQELDPETFIESKVKHMRHTWNFTDEATSAINLPDSDNDLSIWMVRRNVFDNALAMQAVMAGADLIEETTVSSIKRENGEIKLYAKQKNNREDFIAKSRYLIGADGAKGQVSKVAGLRPNRKNVTAIEIEYPYEWRSGNQDLRLDVMHLEYGAIPGGYAWVFPKKNHLNIGGGIIDNRFLSVGQNQKEIIHKAISGYLDHLEIPHDKNKLTYFAHPIPIWNGKEQLHTDDSHILLVGDAAGLVNPYLGDGISHAITSGSIAAECVANNTVDQYTDKIYDKLGSHFDASLRLANIFYRFPRLLYPLVKRSRSAHHAMEMLRGNTPRLSTPISQFIFNWMLGFKH